MSSPELVEGDPLWEQAQAWLEQEPDPENRSALQEMIQTGDRSSLESCFQGPLQFGTAGLRGLIGPGPHRMNQITVGGASAGLARQLLADVSEASSRGVVVGRDARRKSPEMARIAAEVLAGHGLQVYWFDEPVPTPVAAFACQHLQAAAAVVVTASHNPPDYNGFKVYSERAFQIVSPQDARIRAEADAAGAFTEMPRLPFEAAVDGGQIRILGPEISEAFYSALDTQCLGPVPPPTQVRVVTTALHGVGHSWVDEALRRRGHQDIHPVPSQMAPDGGFPTVRFPNPEEPGALDQAMATGREVDADLLLANDPDTDRLCAGVRDGESPGGYRVLTGNELGTLLGDWIMGQRAEQGTLQPGSLAITTVVSTTMLRRVGASYGVRVTEVLTGFKWIWDKALEAAASNGETFVFGFEEALGYCVGPVVRDKDGIGAAQVLMELAADLGSRGESLLDRLESLERTHGVHHTRQVVAVIDGVDGPERLARVMGALRRDPPAHLAGLEVERIQDLQGPDAEAEGLPRSNVWTCWLRGGHRLVVRPSGTEPKLKAYIEARGEAHDGVSLSQARERAEQLGDEMATWVRQVVEG